MFDTTPGEIGDVEQAIDSAEIHECAVVGQVLDDAFDDLSFLESGQQRLALG